MRICDNQEVLAVRKLREKKENGKICSHGDNWRKGQERGRRQATPTVP